MNPVLAEEPEGEIKEAIERDFGSLDEFKKQFKAAGATQFGSGWAWLTKGSDSKLKVTKTPNAENPLCHGETPLLTMDVWEHACGSPMSAHERVMVLVRLAIICSLCSSAVLSVHKSSAVAGKECICKFGLIVAQRRSSTLAGGICMTSADLHLQ